MKNFVESLKLFFVICGATIGAGFLSGGELIAFFPSRSLPCLAIAGTVFFLYFILPIDGNSSFFKYAYLAADAVFAASMLSVADEIAWNAGIFKGLPIVSVVSLSVFELFFSEDIKRLVGLNSVLIPFSVFVAIFAAISAEVFLSQSEMTARDGVNALLYACANAFAAFPSVKLAAYGKNKAVKIAAAGGFGVFFVALSYVILRASPNVSLPLISVSVGKSVYPFLFAAIYVGAFTSFACCAFSIRKAAVKGKAGKCRGLYVALLYGILFVFSRLGVGRICRYVYPLLGGLGAFTLIKRIFGIKNRAGEIIMKKNFLRRKLCPQKRIRSKNLLKKNTANI
ncbi:MAG: hypothetical protein IJU83_00960 [Clostridia bacterium]|nr:hypothetical protein [Clostridia bacterium]